MSSHLQYEIVRQHQSAARNPHAHHLAELRAARPSQRSVSWRVFRAVATGAGLRPRQSPAFS